jgi:hypothetical protein
MRASPGILSHTPLGLLVLLSAGAIVLSLVTAPSIAQQRLQGAARDTIDASSFVLDFNALTFSKLEPSTARGGKFVETGAVEVKFEYQAPDRVLQERYETSVLVSALVIGRNSYERIGSGPWLVLPQASPSGSSAGAQVAAEILGVLQPLAGATSVVRSGSTYRFAPGNRVPLLTDFFGQAAGQLSSVEFSAVLDDKFVKTERIVATRDDSRYTIDFDFLSVGAAPPIEAPSAARP